MIKSFNDKEAELIFQGHRSKKLPQSIQKSAYVKLRMLHAAEALKDLRIPPGNRLHELHGDREGQWSISINDQYRICFLWNDTAKDADNVEITDYH